MVDIIEHVRVFLEGLLAVLGYGGIVLLAAIETLVPPLPSDWIVPFAGMLVAQGELHGALVIGAAVLGSLLGATGQYALGYRFGRRVVRDVLRRRGRWLLLGEADLDRAEWLFSRGGGFLIPLGHLVPGVRGLISLPAGMSQMPLLRF